MFTTDDFNHLSTYFLANEALSRGYTVEKIFPKTKQSELIITNKDKQTIIFGQRASNLSYNAFYICKYKDITKQFLSKNNINISEGSSFSPKEPGKALDYFNKFSKPVVIKPTSGTWGTDVFLNIETEHEAAKIIKTLSEKKAFFLIEEQSVGKEYRILATRDEVLGIIHRIPANVIGDGNQTIEELVTVKNSDPRRSADHTKTLINIQLDDVALELLQKQNLTSSSIPAKNVQILLRDNSNISTGGDSIDYTDKVHPNINKIATEVIRAIPGLPYAGFDFLTPDITKDPYDVGYTVIEINDSPMTSMHHEPYEGKQRNVSAKIIDLLFE